MQNQKPRNPFSKEKVILTMAAVILGVLVTFQSHPTEKTVQYLYNRLIGEDNGTSETMNQSGPWYYNTQEGVHTQQWGLPMLHGTQENGTQENGTQQPGNHRHFGEGTGPGVYQPVSGEAGQGLYTDISSSDPNYAALKYLKDYGIMKGYPDGTFRPDKNVNRAEIIKIIVRALGEPNNLNDHKNCFTDVKTQWFAPYGCYAKWKGWVKGYGDGGYHPSNNVTRAEALKMIIEAFGIQLETAPPAGSDFANISPDVWYARYVWTAEKANLMAAWKDNTPDNLSNPITRMEVATAIYTLVFAKNGSI